MGKRTHGPYLLVAIDNNSLRAVKEILALHIKAKSKVREICITEIKRRQSNHFDCPLMLAAKLHDPSIIKYLLDREVNINHVRQRGFGRQLKIETALIIACRNGNFASAALILSANCVIDVQDHKGRTALHYAVRNANFRLTKLLLSRGAQCNISDKVNNAPIHIATKYGHFELAKILIQYGADLYKKGEDGAIPIHMAAKEGHVGLVKLFCCSDVNVNTKVPCYDKQREMAPIHVACEEGHAETVMAMVEQFGADIQIRDSDGETPLHCAVLNPYDTNGMKSKDDYTETARVLITYGADVNVRNGRGETPLHLAARNEYQRIAEILVETGANPTLPDNDSNKPIDLVSTDDTVTRQVIKTAVEKQDYINKLRISNPNLELLDQNSPHLRNKAMSTTNIPGVQRQLFGRTVSTPGLYAPAHRRHSEMSLSNVNESKCVDQYDYEESATTVQRRVGKSQSGYKRAISFDAAMLKSQGVEDARINTKPYYDSDGVSLRETDHNSSIDSTHFEDSAYFSQMIEGRRAFSVNQIPESEFRSFKGPPDSPLSPKIPQRDKKLKNRIYRSTSAVMENSDSDTSSMFELSPLASAALSPPQRRQKKQTEDTSKRSSEENLHSSPDKNVQLSTSNVDRFNALLPTRRAAPSPTPSRISAPTPPPDAVARPPTFKMEEQNQDKEPESQNPADESDARPDESDARPDSPIYKNIDYYTNEQDKEDYNNKMSDNPAMTTDDTYGNFINDEQPIYTNDDYTFQEKPVTQKPTETTDDDSYFDDSSFSDEDFQEQDTESSPSISALDKESIRQKLLNAQMKPRPLPSIPNIPPPINPPSPQVRKSREPVVPPVSMRMIEEENSGSDIDDSTFDEDDDDVDNEFSKSPSTYRVPQWDRVSTDSGSSLFWENPDTDDFIGILRSTNSTPVVEMTGVPPDNGHHAASLYHSRDATINDRPKVSKTNITVSFKDKGTRQNDMKNKFAQTQTVLSANIQPTRKHFVPSLPASVVAEMTDRLQHPISRQVIDEYKFNRAIGSLNAASTDSLEKHVDETPIEFHKVQKRLNRPMSPPPLPPKVVSLANSDMTEGGYKDMNGFIRGVQNPPIPSRNGRLTKSTPPPFTDLHSHTASQLSLLSSEGNSPEHTDNDSSRNNSPQKGSPESKVISKPRPPPEPRTVSFHSDGKIGVKIVGGNKDGIFISAVEGGSPAENNGITEGDLIISINNDEMRGKTREDALLLLMGLHGKITMIVQNDMERYEWIIQNGGAGDSFHIRTNFSYDRMRDNELGFTIGEIMSVVDTLPDGQIGNWRVIRVHGSTHGTHHREGFIPNISRAEQIALLQQRSSSNEEGRPRGGIFRRSLRKSKSTEKLDKVTPSSPVDKHDVVPYERVEMKPYGFVRPVVLLGAVSDIVIDKLVDDRPERFVSMNVGMDAQSSEWSNNQPEDQVVKLYDERPIRFSVKHCVFSASPATIEYLRDASLCPITIFLKAENKGVVKNIRSRYGREGKKVIGQLLDEANTLEKEHSDLFTAVVSLTSDDNEPWYSLLLDTIDRLQKQELWLPVMKGGDSRPSSIALSSRRNSVSSTRSEPPVVMPPALPAPRRTGSNLSINEQPPKLATPYEVAQLHATQMIHAYEDIDEVPAHIRKSIKNQRVHEEIKSETNKDLIKKSNIDDQHNQYIEGHMTQANDTHNAPTYAMSSKQKVHSKSQNDLLSMTTEDKFKEVDILSYMNGPVSPSEKMANKRNYVDPFQKSPSKSILKNGSSSESSGSDTWSEQSSPAFRQRQRQQNNAMLGYHMGITLSSMPPVRKVSCAFYQWL